MPAVSDRAGVPQTVARRQVRQGTAPAPPPRAPIQKRTIQAVRGVVPPPVATGPTKAQTKALKKVRRVERQEQRAVKTISRIVQDDPAVAKVKLSSKVSKPTVTQKKLLVPPKTVRQLLSDSTAKQQRATVDLLQPKAPKLPKGKAPKKPPQRPPTRPKKPSKVKVSVPEIVPPKLRKAVAKQGQRLNEALDKTGSPLSGPEYLAKLVQFESGWNPKAENPSSAYGLGQFIDSTAADFRERLNVETQDPSRPKQMLKGAAMHASGKHGYGALYAGYNPGYSSTDPIPPVASGKNVTVKVPRKAVKKLSAGAPIGKPVKQQPGEWAGSERAVLALIPKGVRAEGKGDKRTPSENAAVGGATASDHLTTNETAYGADIPPDPKVYANLRSKLGLPPASSGSDSVVKDGYRYQLIFGAEHGHGDHIHLGAQWVGAGIPAGTTLGGTVAGGTGSSTSGSVSPPGAALLPATPRKTKRGKAKKTQGRARSRLIRQLIAQGPAVTPELPTLSTESFSDYAREQPIEVGL